MTRIKEVRNRSEISDKEKIYKLQLHNFGIIDHLDWFLQVLSSHVAYRVF